MTLDSDHAVPPTFPDSVPFETMITVDAVRYQLDLADETMIAILVADASPGIHEAIIGSDISWDVVGIDDGEAEHRRTDLNIPDSIQWTSPSCFCDSLVKSFTFSLNSSLKRLAGFARCSVERIAVPQRVEIIEGGLLRTAASSPL
jgi:hypothetical protein